MSVFKGWHTRSHCWLFPTPPMFEPVLPMIILPGPVGMGENASAVTTSERKQRDRKCRSTTKDARNCTYYLSLPTLHTLCASFKNYYYKWMASYLHSYFHSNYSQDFVPEKILYTILTRLTHRTSRKVLLLHQTISIQA